MGRLLISKRCENIPADTTGMGFIMSPLLITICQEVCVKYLVVHVL